MKNLFRKPARQWFPDADATSAPEGALLQADNLVPDPEGVLALRQGSSNIYSGLQHQRVHSLYTAVLPAGTFRLAGIDNRVYRNGQDFGQDFTGSGDIAFDDDAYQVYMARGTTKKKFDGTNFFNWGMSKPALPASLATATAITSIVASFASSESPAFVINEGTSSFVTGHDSVANGALRLVPNSGTGRTSASKKFLSDQDFLNIGGTEGSETDLFDMFVWLEEPRKVDKITIMFGLGTGDDAYKDDYYYFEFPIRNAQTVDVKDASSGAAAAYSLSTQKLQSVLTPEQITDVKTPEQVAVILKRLGRFAGPRSRERADSLEASPAWTHLSVQRGSFNRVGGTAGRNWKTVRGFKIVYTAVPGSTEAAQFDSAVIVGGGNRSLTGTYKVGYRFFRDVLDTQGNRVYRELSPFSDISNEIVLSQQALQVTIPAAALAAADPQATGTLIYVYGGFLNNYYVFAETGLSGGGSLRIDEFARAADGNDYDIAADRTRLTSHGLSIPGAVSGNMVIDIQKSELEALIENDFLEPGSVGPPDNIIAIAGPWNRRMFVLTSEGLLYVSLIDGPSLFSLYHLRDLRQYGDPKWMVQTSGGIHVGMSKDVIRMAGFGDESEDRVTIDLFAEQLHVGNPPADAAVQTDGNAIIYRSADGLMLLVGASLTPISQGGTSLLWRGQARYNSSPLNTSTGRFRLAVDNHILFMLASEGTSLDPTSLWRYDFVRKVWARTYYTPTLLSIFRDPDGSLIAGTANGALLLLESGVQDNGANISINITTPIDGGDNPLVRKDACDFQIHADTGGAVGTADFRLDGIGPVSISRTFSTVSPAGIYRVDLLNPDKTEISFYRMQLAITGSFNKFLLYAFNVTYRDRVQQTMVLDTGTIRPRDGRDMSWLQEVEIDCISPANLEMDLYLDDVLKTTQPVIVKANRRSTYRVPLPKGSKARAPRLVFRTTNSGGSSNPGFEPYMVRVRDRSTGNESEHQPFRTVFPLGEAP